MNPMYDRDGITIYHGDCLDVLPLLDKVDHVITDPPYARDVYVRMSTPNSHPQKAGDATSIGLGRDRKMNSRAQIQALAAGDIGFIDHLIEPLSVHFARLVRRWVLTFSDVETCHEWRSELELAGLRYVRTGAWVKPDPMPQFSGDRPAVGFEPCTIAHAPGPMRWNGGGRAGVWTHNTAKGADRPNHPCPKPLSLMRELIEQFTDPGDVILDPFMGSGTTLRAAKDLGRRAIGIEMSNEIGEDGIDRRYCDIAIARLAQSVLAL